MEILRKRCDILSGSGSGWTWRISTAAAAARTPFWIYCKKVCCCHCWLVSGERKLVEGLLAGILTGIPFSEFVEQQFGNIYRQHVLCSKTADRLHKTAQRARFKGKITLKSLYVVSFAELELEENWRVVPYRLHLHHHYFHHSSSSLLWWWIWKVFASPIKIQTGSRWIKVN